MPRPVAPRGRPGTPMIPSGALAMHRRLSSDPTTMPYTVRIRDRDEQGPLDPDTGQHTVIPGDVHYIGPGRLHPVPLNERQVVVADQPMMLSRWYARVPLGTVVAENMRLDVLDADEHLADVSLVGRTFRVSDDTPRTFGTELRITVTEEPVPRSGEGQT